MRVPGAVAVRLVRDTVVFWILVHAVAMLSGVQALTVSAHVAVVLLVMALAYFDVRATHERVLWANLAIGTGRMLGVVLVVAGILEAGLAWAMARFPISFPSELLF